MTTDTTGLVDPDGFYEAWADAQHGLDAEASADLNARLVLLLADRVGDPAVLLECVAVALASRRPAAD